MAALQLPLWETERDVIASLDADYWEASLDQWDIPTIDDNAINGDPIL